MEEMRYVAGGKKFRLVCLSETICFPKVQRKGKVSVRHVHFKLCFPLQNSCCLWLAGGVCALTIRKDQAKDQATIRKDVAVKLHKSKAKPCFSEKKMKTTFEITSSQRMGLFVLNFRAVKSEGCYPLIDPSNMNVSCYTCSKGCITL